MGMLRMRLQVMLCCAHHTLLVSRMDRLGGIGVQSAGFYFDECQCAPAFGDEIDLAHGCFIAHGENAVALQP